MTDDPDPLVPKYMQIARHYQRLIEDKRLMAGEKLPPIPRIGEEHHVARETAAKALRVLRDNGYVHTSPQGSIVIDRTRPGVFRIEVLPPRHKTGCRSTVHCASFGFCHRCAPELNAASKHVMDALLAIGQHRNGELYGQVMDLLRTAGSPAGAEPGTEAG